MITEQEWALFGQRVSVGTRVQWRHGDLVLEGVLLENYPHAERARHAENPDLNIDTLNVRFDDDGAIDPILARYERFWVWDDWYGFDDIVMGDEGDLPARRTNWVHHVDYYTDGSIGIDRYGQVEPRVYRPTAASAQRLMGATLQWSYRPVNVQIADRIRNRAFAPMRRFS